MREDGSHRDQVTQNLADVTADSPAVQQADSETKSRRSNRSEAGEQGWWKQLADAGDPDEAAKAWAPLMFEMSRTSETQSEACVVFILDPASGRLRVAAHWPEGRMVGNALLIAAETAVKERRGVVRGALPGGPSGSDFSANSGLVSIATPLMVGDDALGAVGMEILPTNQPAMVSAMRRLQWGAAWMRDMLRAKRAESDSDRFDRAVNALHIVVDVAEREDFPTASRAAATDLAARFDCDRVSIGFRRFGRSWVSAVSHSAGFGKRMNLMRMLAAAMDEAIDQRMLILFPLGQSDDEFAAHRHEILARSYGAGHVLTVPLYAIDRYVGAAVFERPKDKPFRQVELDMLEATVTVLAPVLDEKRRNDRWLISKAAEAVSVQFARLVGPARLARKATALALVAATLFFYFAHMDYRVTAVAVVEGVVQRAVVAAIDGFVAEAPVRAGDEVKKGDLLVRLDDRDLALERLRLVTARQRHKIEFDRSVSERNRAETSIRQTQMAQADAQIQLVDEQLARTRMLAPFDGLIVAGDLSQSIGAAVTRGESLMTIAPLDAYRVAMKIDERRISEIKLGQTGSLLVTALPQTPFAVRVEKITPVAQYGEGTTTFRVEASLTGDIGALRPGMEGVAKIDVDERRVIAVWVRPLLDWFRVWVWRWIPS